MPLMTLNDVFTDQIEDLYSAETQLVEAFPKIAGAAPMARPALLPIKEGLGIAGAQRCSGAQANRN